MEMHTLSIHVSSLQPRIMGCKDLTACFQPHAVDMYASTPYELLYSQS